MKKIITILVLLTTLSTKAQNQFFETVSENAYLSAKFDPKMAFVGLGHSYGDEKAFNYEIEVGWEYDGIRFGMAIEENHQIDYRKWTLIKVDYVLRDYLLFIPIDNFVQSAGAEISTIYRWNVSWREREENKSIGLNFEIQYEFTNWFAVGLQTNFFTAEAALIRYDKYIRYDVMFGLIFKNRN